MGCVSLKGKLGIKLKDKVYLYEVSECKDCDIMLNADTCCFRCSIDEVFCR